MFKVLPLFIKISLAKGYAYAQPPGIAVFKVIDLKEKNKGH